MMVRTGRQFDEAYALEGYAHRVFADAHTEFFMEPGNLILDPPTDRSVQCGDQSFPGDLRQDRAVFSRQLGRGIGRFAVNQPLRSLGGEAQHPIPDNLNRDPADPSRIKPFAAIIDRRVASKHCI